MAVLDQVAAKLKPRIIVPDHSDVGGISLIAKERSMIVDIQSRAMALKSQGKSAAEAGKIITDEFRTKYQGWAGMNNLPLAVQQAYADPDPQ